MGKTFKRIIIAGFAAIVILFMTIAVHGYVCTKVASIVNDEAEWDLRDASPSMKVIILKDGNAARYVDENESWYVGEIQDEFTIPKEEAEVETWYACDGKGMLFLKECGTQPVFRDADGTTDIIASLRYDSGEAPHTYRCLGYRDGWFSVEVDGISGYVMEDKVIWDAIDSF